MSKRLVPLTENRVCLAYTWRSTIHASIDAPLVVAKQTPSIEMGARTACGVDAPTLVHGTVDGDFVVMAAWPPPSHARDADRCPDCVSRVGAPRVAPHWKLLVDREVAS